MPATISYNGQTYEIPDPSPIEDLVSRAMWGPLRRQRESLPGQVLEQIIAHQELPRESLPMQLLIEQLQAAWRDQCKLPTPQDAIDWLGTLDGLAWALHERLKGRYRELTIEACRAMLLSASREG